LYNGAFEWKDAHTPLQKSVTGGVFLYGILGIASVYGVLRRRQWSAAVVATWGLVVTYVATAAVFAYGGSDASVGGAIAGGGATALIAVGTCLATGSTTAAPSENR
jgi:hypothetical protein